MSKSLKNPAQTALFDIPIIDIKPFKKALSAALKAAPLSRDQAADRISLFLGRAVSRAEIDSWTAESKPGHLPRTDELIALIYATCRPEPLDAIAGVAKFSVIGAADAELLELAQLREQREVLNQRIETIENRRMGRRNEQR